ncbi:hypothetical protein N0V90_002756 [Kalmusia sp. IMI 367209]|nr:hypothetical protein N0V90_002756 [Kalmusia sp. IMI 367209]
MPIEIVQDSLEYDGNDSSMDDMLMLLAMTATVGIVSTLMLRRSYTSWLQYVFFALKIVLWSSRDLATWHKRKRMMYDAVSTDVTLRSLDGGDTFASESSEASDDTHVTCADHGRRKFLVPILFDIVLSLAWIAYLSLNFSKQIHQTTVIARPILDMDFASQTDIELVISMYKEPIDHVHRLISALKAIPNLRESRIHIYVKDSEANIDRVQQGTGAHKVTLLENVGREGETYLFHILNAWDTLAKHTVFLQAGVHNPREFYPRVRDYFDPDRTGMLSLGWSGQVCNCENCGDRFNMWDTTYLFPEISHRINNTTKCDKVLLSYKGQFIASAKRIRGVDRSVYKYLHDAFVERDSWAHQEEYLQGRPDSMEAPVFGMEVSDAAEREQNWREHRGLASGYNDTGRFYNFSNIRYAAPPVGQLRFAPPEAPAENRSIINNGTIGRICPQASPAWTQLSVQALTNILLGSNSTDIPVYVPPGANLSSVVPSRDALETEDCLFLDVFVPEQVFDRANSSNQSAPKSSVLVWIYGGGYTGGDKYNNPAGLLAESGKVGDAEVIYVAINYRLGALGWLSGPSYQAEGGVSNLGLYDQRFALEWVQKHIHLFGGDPNRVTIFGESAGGGSIMHQITAYGGAKGPSPFQQAVPQSPGWVPVQSNTFQEDRYRKFLNLTNSTSLADLRNVSSEAVILANAQQVAYDSPWGGFVYGPVVDGLFTPLQVSQLLAQGRFDKSIRVMVGHNANEGTYFTPPYVNTTERIVQQLEATLYNVPQSSVDYITQELYPAIFDGSYGYTDNFTRASLIVSEGIFTCNTNYLSTGFKNKTYSYLFSVPPAFHGFDIAYTYFDGGATSAVNPLQVQNRTVAVALQEFITSFAKNGVPEAEGIRKFDMYGPDAKVLDLDVKGIEEVTDSNAGPRCKWWQLGLVS